MAIWLQQYDKTCNLVMQFFKLIRNIYINKQIALIKAELPIDLHISYTDISIQCVSVNLPNFQLKNYPYFIVVFDMIKVYGQKWNKEEYLKLKFALFSQRNKGKIFHRYIFCISNLKITKYENDNEQLDLNKYHNELVLLKIDRIASNCMNMRSDCNIYDTNLIRIFMI